MVLAADASLDPIQLLLINAGTAGVVVVLILVGWLWAKPSVMREFDKADKKAAEDKALIESLLAAQREVIPLLIEIDKRIVPMMGETQAMLKRTEALVDRMEREWEWRERSGRVQEETPRSPQREHGDRYGSSSRERPGSDDYRAGEERPR